jgi:hypothetical protein
VYTQAPFLAHAILGLAMRAQRVLSLTYLGHPAGNSPFASGLAGQVSGAEGRGGGSSTCGHGGARRGIGRLASSGLVED